MDLTCPISSNHHQPSTVTTPIISHARPSSHLPSQSPSPPLLDAPPTNRIKQCSNCGNRRSCKQVAEN